MTTPYDSSIAQFNTLLQQSQQAMVCGPECQKAKTAQTLNQQYLDSQTNLKTAPAQVQTAAKNYYTFVGGTAGYNNYVSTELGAKAESLVTELKNVFSKNFSSVKALCDTFSTQLINSQYAQQIYDKYLEENSALENELKDNSYDIFTNDRKTYYEDQGVDNLKWWSRGFSVFYWILVVAYIICFFISSSGFSVLSRILILLFLIIYPFIASRIFNYIISIFYRISSVLPKNSYLHN